MGLGNQGGLALADEDRVLLGVNAGSHDVSVFEVSRSSLMLTDVEPSGGNAPISIAVYQNLVYVLNAADAGSVNGFRLSNGDLTPIADSMRALSGAAMTGPAQAALSLDGRVLVVTEKATSLIDTFLVGQDGLQSEAIVNTSNGETPFGFTFTKHGFLLVSEAFMGAVDASAVSSYWVNQDGTLSVVSPSVPTTETAACWVAATRNGKYAYTTNTGSSSSISGYRVDQETGEIGLRDEGGVTAETGDGSRPIDLALTHKGQFMYVLNAGTWTITAFRSNPGNGSLDWIQTVDGLPEGANGMAAR